MHAFARIGTDSELARGAPILPSQPKGLTGTWRYSLLALDWVRVQNDPQDDVIKLRERYYRHQWFEPFWGVWEEQDET